MRHFEQISQEHRAELFAREPGEFDTASPLRLLSHALGATLYVPGTRGDLLATLRRRVADGVRSMVIDLEDAVSDRMVDTALGQVHDTLAELTHDPMAALLFVRVRAPEQIRLIADKLEYGSTALTGFVLPKFSAAGGGRALADVVTASEQVGARLLAMPVLETPDVLYRETRGAALAAIRDVLAQYRDHVLAVRMGATDLCGLFGIRRDRDFTIYDVGVVAELITEVVNHLGRADGTGYAITGPVWEYFAGHERMFRPQLRETPFTERNVGFVRNALVRSDGDGLLREVLLDRANGLTGKTVIHPSHVPLVHALSIVPYEEFADAADILTSFEDGGGSLGEGGVRASGYRNKMNEMRPHRRWAQRVHDRAAVFGVARPGVSHVDVLAALAGAEQTVAQR